MSPDFPTLARERAVIQHLKQHLIERYLPDSGAPPRETLHCDDLPHSERVIPVESILGMVERLTEEENQLSTELNKFVHIQNVVRPLAKAPKPEEPPTESTDTGEENEPGKPAARKQRPRKAKPGAPG